MHRPGVEVERDQGVLTLTIARPPVNALGLPELTAVADIASSPPSDVHALVFRARGPGFGGGNELSDFVEDPATYRSNVALVQRMLEAVYSCRLLTIAVVTGYCVGSSALLAASSDICVASSTAWFAFPELSVGAPGGYRLLRERMGQRSAREVLLSCRQFDAGEAQRLGLVDRVVDDEQLARVEHDYLDRFGPDGEWDGTLLVDLKRRLNTWLYMDLWDGYRAELDFGAYMRTIRRTGK